MSNLIKAYSVSYQEEKKIVDVSKKADELDQTKELIGVKPENVFVSGLQAISLTECTEAAAAEQPVEEETEAETPEEKIQKAEQLRKELQKVKYELTQAEKIALRIEMEKNIRTQADIILEQARAEGEQLKLKAKLAGEAEKQEILKKAKQDGYAEGRQNLLEEQNRMEREYAEKEQQLCEQYDKKIEELSPKATEVVISLLSGLTGVLLDGKRPIITYLVEKALTGAERGTSFLIKVSGEDYSEVKDSLPKLRSLFEREVLLEVVKDTLLTKGQCLIETEFGIVDCSLDTELSGLIEDIRMMHA